MASKLLQIKYLVLGIALSACGPNRPPLTICFFSVEAQASMCTDPKGVDTQVPVANMDKWFTMNREDSERLLEYVIELEKKAARCP